MAVLTLSEKLDQLGARYDELTKQLSTSEIVSDTSHFQKVAKELQVVLPISFFELAGRVIA